MFRMAVGHSDDIDLDAALATVFEQCEAALAGAAPKAGLLMAAWEADHRSIVDAVRARYPGIELAGSTTAGEMSSVLGFQEDSIALTLVCLRHGRDHRGPRPRPPIGCAGRHPGRG